MSYKFDPALWKETEIPKHKKDYDGKYLKLLVDSPNMRGYDKSPSPIKAGAILWIAGRYNYGQASMSSYRVNSNLFHDNKDRVLKVTWHCPQCDASHDEGLPEAWLAEGKLVFVARKSQEELREAA